MIQKHMEKLWMQHFHYVFLKCIPSDLSLDTNSENAYKYAHANYFADNI